MDDLSQTKTLVGHNLEPTPWHVFPQKNFSEETRHGRAYKIIQCSYLTCPYSSKQDDDDAVQRNSSASTPGNQKCPEFFRFIHYDLQPWVTTRISKDHVMAAKEYAAFRVVIKGGRLYVDLYYDCVQSRMMFTIWGFLQLLRRYPGRVPDVDMMFDCMDKPTINRTEHQSFPLPLFRYCTTDAHFDIPFPDWSFWGWPEIRIKPWDEQFREIKQGSQTKRWTDKIPLAYWKGNPGVLSPIREALLLCNNSMNWGAEILIQNWQEEVKSGFKSSKLSNQCNHRYKIYAEGYAWSVSLKYIISCGSLSLIITPQYEDFFSRGLVPQENYWPVTPFPPTNLCPSIKSAVDWGNVHPLEAEAMGKRGQDFMENLGMDRVYDYMFHLISEYAKLQDFKPEIPSSAQEACKEYVLCFADETQSEFLERSAAVPSSAPPCSLEPADPAFINGWLEKKRRTVEDVRIMVEKSIGGRV